MARLIHTGIKAEPRPPIAASHCRAAIDGLKATVENRPNYQPNSPTALVLHHPACEHQCSTCYMACAIAPDRLAWWKNELVMAEAYEAGAALQHGGVLFLEPAGRA